MLVDFSREFDHQRSKSMRHTRICRQKLYLERPFLDIFEIKVEEKDQKRLSFYQQKMLIKADKKLIKADKNADKC